MLAVADEDGSICLFDLRKQGPGSKLKGIYSIANSDYYTSFFPFLNYSLLLQSILL